MAILYSAGVIFIAGVIADLETRVAAACSELLEWLPKQVRYSGRLAWRGVCC